jgi:hypothetical protein
MNKGGLKNASLAEVLIGRGAPRGNIWPSAKTHKPR